jgi:hypothetical protein
MKKKKQIKKQQDKLRRNIKRAYNKFTFTFTQPLKKCKNNRELHQELFSYSKRMD